MLTGFTLRSVTSEIPNDAPPCPCQSGCPVYTSTARPNLEDNCRDGWLRRWARRSHVSMIHKAAAKPNSIVDAQRLTRPVGGWLSSSWRRHGDTLSVISQCSLPLAAAERWRRLSPVVTKSESDCRLRQFMFRSLYCCSNFRCSPVFAAYWALGADGCGKQIRLRLANTTFADAPKSPQLLYLSGISQLYTLTKTFCETDP